MRKGFTMIELIFVIVILGILAAVALPKLTTTAADAKIATAEAFIGTLNRTVAPSMWSRSMRDGNGSIKSNFTLSSYTDVPKGFTLTNNGLADCKSTGDGNGSKVATFGAPGLPSSEDIYCRDGNSTSAPMFGFSVDLNTSVQTNKTN